MCLVHEYITAVGDISLVRLKGQLWEHTKFYSSFVSKNKTKQSKTHNKLEN